MQIYKILQFLFYELSYFENIVSLSILQVASLTMYKTK